MTDISAEDRLTREAGAFITKQFIEIKTYSHYRMSLSDPSVKSTVLVVDAPEEALGQALLIALAHSRFLSLEEARQIRLTGQTNYQTWIKERMQQFRYKSKRALFRYMNHCFISSFEGRITIRPQCHEKIEGWGRERDDGIENVILPDTAHPSEVGAGLRLAFSRCISKIK